MLLKIFQFMDINKVRSAAVYAASSTKIKQVYFDAARLLGKVLAENGIRLIYGAGHMGLMGEVATSVLEIGGTATGVIPEFMIEKGWHKTDLTQLIVTKDMHERKATIERLSDILIALPGGIGTFDELFEILTWKQLGLHTKPIIILNIDGYYNEWLACVRKMVDEHFLLPVHENLFSVIDDPKQLVSAIVNAPAWDASFSKHAKI